MLSSRGETSPIFSSPKQTRTLQYSPSFCLIW